MLALELAVTLASILNVHLIEKLRMNNLLVLDGFEGRHARVLRRHRVRALDGFDLRFLLYHDFFESIVGHDVADALLALRRMSAIHLSTDLRLFLITAELAATNLAAALLGVVYIGRRILQIRASIKLADGKYAVLIGVTESLVHVEAGDELLIHEVLRLSAFQGSLLL